MKIQKLAEEALPKVYALLRSAFPGSEYEAGLVRRLHENDRLVHEWVCLHAGKVIAYIAFSNAYNGSAVCGLHLAPMAVTPEFQKQGVGSELLKFALRQDALQSRTLFVLGEPGYYRRFGFESCNVPICPFDTNNSHFLSMRNNGGTHFVVGYEPEFIPVTKATKSKGRRRR